MSIYLTLNVHSHVALLFVVFKPIFNREKKNYPLKIFTISSREAMREKKLSVEGLLVDPIPYSPDQNHKNCMAECKENC